MIVSSAFTPEECPDWDFARNRRTALMTPSAEWVQGVYSCAVTLDHQELIVPNRDYSYEGLLAYQGGENWKFIDCIGVGFGPGRGARGEPQHAMRCLQGRGFVGLSPCKVDYNYAFSPAQPPWAGTVPLLVTHKLHSITEPGYVTGSVELCTNRPYYGDPVDWKQLGYWLVVQPFIDLRHMFAGSDFSSYAVVFSGTPVNKVRISYHNRILTFFLPPGDVECYTQPKTLDWWYKLGTGSRTEGIQDNRPATVFRSENKQIASFFRVYTQKDCSLYFSCQLAGTAELSLAAIQKYEELSANHDQARETEIDALLPERISNRIAYREDTPGAQAQDLNVPDRLTDKLQNALAARIFGLTKFKSLIRPPSSDEPIALPHAGAWWFRTPWFRDVFEGILNSFQTLMTLPSERANIGKIISAALSYQHPITGLIPNRLPEFQNLDLSYNSTDATLLCFIVACRYLSEDWDEKLAGIVLDASQRFVDHLLSDEKVPTALDIDGPPRLQPKLGLLMSVAHHSWIDTRTQTVEHDGRLLRWIPNRFSPSFARAVVSRIPGDINAGAFLSSPLFLLPEINAQWILVLRGIQKTLDHEADGPRSFGHPGDTRASFRKTVAELLSSAESHFAATFWNEDLGFLFNAVLSDPPVQDTIECEAAVTAAALLGESVFSPHQLSSIWQHTQRTLLIYRRLVSFGNRRLPFGILTKNDKDGPFYGDDRYHSDVMWLRSSPYLISLLLKLGHRDIVEGILVNTLDHQMTEGAIFYNHELFSKPVGNNPARVDATCDNPVPVKNPIQFWSQWCDPFLDFFGTKEAAK